MRITLCGSAKFESAFKEWNERLSLQGHVVYSLAVYPSDKMDNKNWYTPKEKLKLDKVHKDKIHNSDAVLVLNVGGYIGDSTTSEIKYAHRSNKRVYYLNPCMHGDEKGQLICPYAGCSDSINNRRTKSTFSCGPCALCYE